MHQFQKLTVIATSWAKAKKGDANTAVFEEPDAAGCF
jgi:hypothetical protein